MTNTLPHAGHAPCHVRDAFLAESLHSLRPYALRDEARDKRLDADIAEVNGDCEPGSREHNSELMLVFAKHLYGLCASGGEWHDAEHLLRSMIGCLLNSRTGRCVVMLPHPGAVPDDLMDNWVYPMLKSMGTDMMARDAAVTREIAGTGQRLTLIANKACGTGPEDVAS